MNHLNTNAQAPSARALAYQALYDILEKGAYSNLRLQTALKKNHLKGPEAHLLTELVYGTLRKYKYLIWICLYYFFHINLYGLSAVLAAIL